MSVSTRGMTDMLDALMGRNQDDENKSKSHVTDEVQMHRLAASAGRSSSTLCLPGLPSASVATNIAHGQQNTKGDAHGRAAANDLFPDGAHACAGDCYGCDESTTRIHPIKELHDEALKYFEKQALLHERSVQEHVRTQKEIDRLTSVTSAMEQSKYKELKFIYPPGTSPFKAPSDVAEMNEALQESLENDYVLPFTIPKGTSRRNAMNISHHASNTFIRKVTLQAQTAHLASVKT